MLRCFVRVQLLKLSLEETNPLRCGDQILCQLCQSTFFKINVSAGKFAQLNESRAVVPVGRLLPELPSPLRCRCLGRGKGLGCGSTSIKNHICCTPRFRGRTDLIWIKHKHIFVELVGAHDMTCSGFNLVGHIM